MPLRPLNKRYFGKGLCAGPYTGIKGSSLIASGEAGPSIPFPLATLPADNDVEFRIFVNPADVPVGVTIAIYPDFTFLATGSDGTYDIPFTLERNGTPTSPPGGGSYALRLIFGSGVVQVSADLAGTYMLAGRVSADLGGTFALGGQVSADLPGNYGLGGLVSADLAGEYSLAGQVSADLAGEYTLLANGVSVGGVTVAEIWAFQMPNGMTAAEMLEAAYTRALGLDQATADRVWQTPITGTKPAGSTIGALQNTAARIAGST